MEAWSEEKPSRMLDWVDAILEKRDRVYSAISTRMKTVTSKVTGHGDDVLFDTGCRAKVHEGTPDEMTITGYRLVRWRWLLVTLGMILTGGFLWLVLYWIPRRKLQLTHEITTLEEAEMILVEEQYKKDFTRYYVKNVYVEGPRPDGVLYPLPQKTSPNFRNVASYRYFHLKKETVIWDSDLNVFYPIHGLDIGATAGFFHKQTGLSKEEQDRRRLVFGPNDILVPFHSVLYLLVKEVLNPFYIFQVFSVCLWFSDQYYYYAATIVILSTGGISLSIYQTRKNQRRLRSTVQSTDIVTILRRTDVEEKISSEDLVPGDLVCIPPGGCELNFDGVLLSGSAIVNEAMLTGESVPETKTAFPRLNLDELFDRREHNRHTLFRGTKVIQTRNYAGHKVLALVIRTGFNTTKGNLVRSIMFPAPVDFKFEKDSYKFVGLLSLIAGIGFIYTCVRLVLAGSTASAIFLDAADLITIVVPPALPAAMTIGSLYAQDRLKKRGIYCISPRTINVSGSIDCVCFDKTGTLTEDGLDLLGVVPVDRVTQDNISFENLISDPTELPTGAEIVQAMSCCHSVTIIEEKLSGDPMDVIMFMSTGWTLEEQSGEESSQFDNIAPTIVRPPNKGSAKKETTDQKSTELSFDFEIGIVRQFQFTSERQCMSVIARGVSASHFTVYCKGSPEKIKSLALPETLPDDFESTLDRYTERGFRVIAIGKRDLPDNVNYRKVQRMERTDTEKDLTFLGLIVMENRIKSETKPTIEELHRALVRTIMVTGDHVQTALSVAKECKMIPINGKVIFIIATEDGGKPDIKYHLPKNGATTNNSLAQLNGHDNGKDTTHMVEIEINRFNDYNFAITGKSFNVVRDHYPDVMEKLCARGAIFARMSPDQKETLVAGLQALGYYVAMCGDGANDVGALKAAHAGVSLSEAEASVASPFTYNQANISCIPRLMREGRCALVTSFGIFKYMAAYSLTQFVSVMILYNFGTNLSDIQFLYIDLFLITIFASCFGITEPFEGELAKQPPSNSLISFVPVCSLLMQLLAVVVFQVLSLTTIQSQSGWFVSFSQNNPTFANTTAEAHYNATFEVASQYACWENYSVFAVSSFQYIILAYAFSKSSPYRKRVFTNYALVTTLLCMTAFTIFVVFFPTKLIKYTLELLLPPDDFASFGWTLVAIIVGNVVACIFLEDFVVEVLFRKLQTWCRSSSRSKPRYVKLIDWMRKTNSWPPLTANPDSQDGDSQDESEISPIKTQVEFEVVDENEAFWKLFPTKSASPSERTSFNVDPSSAVAALNTPTPPISR